MAKSLWSREEHILALNLYWQIPFGKMHKGNQKIIGLANLIGRTPSSVGMKLGNFGRLDPALQKRGISGLKNGAKGEQEVWEDFIRNPEDLAYESEQVKAKWLNSTVEKINAIETDQLPVDGTDRTRVVKTRVNQNIFRNRILSAYNYKCCITGLNTPGLLIAGHIIPWSKDPQNRLNPLNGLCLNRLHDKLFEDGLMWIDPDYHIHFSELFLESEKKDTSDAYSWLKQFEGRKIITPSGFKPSVEFLAAHANIHGH